MGRVTAITLTSDMWASFSMDAFLVVKCHFIDNNKCNTVLLGVGHFSKSYTVENVAAVKTTLMEEWGGNMHSDRCSTEYGGLC